MSVDKTIDPIIVPFTTIPWSKLQLGNLLGSGSYGDVYQATWQGIEVAVKQLHLKTLSGDAAKDFQHEATMMGQCQFPHIVRLYGICQEPNHVAMVMEYLPKGSLYHVLHDANEVLPWNPIRWDIALDIGKGLSYLHDQKIIHRDLKSLNVLLDHQYHAKISDFGFAKVKSESQGTKTKLEIGTLRWMAPELLKRETDDHNVATDIYSYGMVLWEIASRQLPFRSGLDNTVVMNWIKDGEQENVPVDCPEAYGELIKACWQKEAKERPSAEKLVAELKRAKPQEATQSMLPKRAKKFWHADPATPGMRNPINKDKGYELLPASKKDIRKVNNAYKQYPAPGYEIDSVRLIYNPAMEAQFNLQLGFLQNRDQNPAFIAKWANEYETIENKTWRQKVYACFEAMARPYQDSDYPAVKLLPMWHGTKLEVLDSLFKTGYANLATTDSGFLGKGIYFAQEAEYSYRVYGQGGVLLFNIVSCFSVYPIIDGDMQRLGLEDSKANYGNYDGHFAPVISNNPLNFNSVNYYPTKPHQKADYHELVLFQSAQCLPRYIVTLRPMLLKLPGSSSIAMNDIDYRIGNTLFIKSQYKASLPHFEKAADQGGYPAACLRLWRLYQGDLGILENKQKQLFYAQQVSDMISWFQVEARKDKADDAQMNLAECFKNGLGVSKNLTEMVKWYTIAAEQKNVLAQYQLGLCYKKGEGIDQDFEKAVKYFRYAACQGNSEAQNELGDCYYTGEGVSKDFKLAVEYYQLAADQGNATAQNNLGMCYHHAKGVAKDLVKAEHCYRLAIQQGNVDAQTHLENLLLRQAVPKRPQAVKRFFSLSLPKEKNIARPLGRSLPRMNSFSQIAATYIPLWSSAPEESPPIIMNAQQQAKQDELIRYVLEGKLDEVKRIESEGASFLHPDKNDIYALVAAVYTVNLECTRYIESKLPKHEAIKQWAKVDANKAIENINRWMPTELSTNATYGDLMNWYLKYDGAIWCSYYDREILKRHNYQNWGGWDEGYKNVIWETGGKENWARSGGRIRWMAKMHHHLVEKTFHQNNTWGKKLTDANAYLISPDIEVHNAVVKMIRKEFFNTLKTDVETKAGKSLSNTLTATTTMTTTTTISNVVPTPY